MNSEALIHKIQVFCQQHTHTGSFSYLEVPFLFSNLSRIL